MKVDAYGNIKNASAPKKKSAISGGGSFSDILDVFESSESVHSAATSNVAAASLTGMLALQEVSDEDIRKQKMIKRGGEMLDELEKLRRGLLLGTVPVQMLRDLSGKLLQQRQEVSDPRLLALIDDIDLRAAVELAKLETAVRNYSPPD